MAKSVKKMKANQLCLFNDTNSFNNFFDLMDKHLKKTILNATAEAIEAVFTDEETYIDFPMLWGKNKDKISAAIKDPLTLHLTVKFDYDYTGKNPVYEYNLRDILNPIFGALKHSPEKYSKPLLKLSSALKELAKEIDERVEYANEG
jgi:hypothetical protein